MKLRFRTRFPAIMAFLVGALAGCTDSETDPGPRDPAAFRVVAADGTVLAESSGAQVRGALLPAIGAPPDTVHVEWLDEGGNAVDPGEVELHWTVAEGSVAVASPVGGAGDMAVSAAASGQTALSLELRRASGGTVFGPADIPVFVQSRTFDRGAFEILEGCNGVASWNYNPDLGPGLSTGPILLDAGERNENYTLRCLEPYVHHHIERILAGAPDGPFTLEWTSSDPSVVVPVDGAGFSFGLQAGAAGTARLDGIIRVNGLLWAECPGIPVRVVDPAEGSVARFVLQESGAWRVIVVDGDVPSAGACGFAQNPGYVTVPAGELTPHYSIRLLNDACQRVFPDESVDEVLFRIDDPCIARTIGHPFHWGSQITFHFAGVAAGETMARAFYFHEGNLVFQSPRFRVSITG